MNLNRLLLTFFGSGLAPFAPGTVGTAAAMPLGFLVIFLFGANTLTTVVIVVSIISIIEINNYEKAGGPHDDKSIVIDEAVGVWLTMAITYSAMSQIWSSSWDIYAAGALSFINFRLFDIWKPSTIGTIDKKVKGGLGVVGDDLLAGFAAGILNLVIFKAFAYFGL